MISLTDADKLDIICDQDRNSTNGRVVHRDSVTKHKLWAKVD